MIDPAIAAIIGSLITATGSIIVALIQSRKEKPTLDGILLPDHVVLHRSKPQHRWLMIMSFAIGGGVFGYIFGLLSISFRNPPLPPSMSTQTPAFIFTPTITRTITVTSPPSVAPSPTPSSTSTNTYELTPSLTILPTPDIYFGIDKGCIDKQYWTPYNGEDLVTDDNNCWLLTDWGFIAQDNGLYLLPSLNTQAQQHAIYLPISYNAEISFLIRVNNLQTSSDRQANIRFGIVPANPLIPNDGKFLAYHYLPSYPDDVFSRLWQDGNYSEPYSTTLKMRDTQNVVISIQGSFLSVFLDDHIFIDKLVLRFDDRLFWIDFFLPPNSELSAFIYNLAIQER